MCVSQLKVIEEAVSRIRGPRVTRVCDELQGALKHVLDLLRYAGANREVEIFFTANAKRTSGIPLYVMSTFGSPTSMQAKKRFRIERFRFS